jgi:hypothetical protein
MESSPVIVGFCGCLKGRRVLSVVMKILPLVEKQTEVAAVFEPAKYLSLRETWL